jgi:hypothetical protein
MKVTTFLSVIYSCPAELHFNQFVEYIQYKRSLSRKHLLFRDIIRLQICFWEWFCSLQIGDGSIFFVLKKNRPYLILAIPKGIKYRGKKEAYTFRLEFEKKSALC